MDILMDPSDSDKPTAPDHAPNPVDDHFATIIPRRWMFMRAYEDDLEAHLPPVSPGTLHSTTVETVVTLPPRFDVHMVAPLRNLLAPFTDIAHHVSLDGSRVEYIDNAGLGLLQELREAFGIGGGEVTLTNMSLALRLGIELSGLPVELCDDHCAKCGRCEWEPCTVPANIKTITMKRYDNQKLCPDCAPASWLERIDYWMRPIDRRFWMWTDKRFGRKGTPKP